MPSKLTKATAIKAINKRGALLVYPVNNKKDPASVWSEIWPRKKMVWDWNEDGGDDVADMWHMRTVLSRSRQVVYTKWFRGRATLFSFDVFVNLLAFLGGTEHLEMSHESRNAVEVLEQDSPLSTKQLKSAIELEGRLLEPAYNRALKPLWNRLWIVGFGEFEDSSFPSLGIGATKTIFEDLWNEASVIKAADAETFLLQRLGRENLFFKFALSSKKTTLMK